MHEMLGNQYFLARNYQKAADNLAVALQENSGNKPIRRKLIICYTQIGKIQAAMDLFLSLVKEDTSFIINTDPVTDDCPCPELVYDIEAQTREQQKNIETLLTLGMLWLFCDVNRSLDYFGQAQKREPGNDEIKSAISMITAKTKNNPEKHTLTYQGGNI